jgi:ABC-type polysaccharide/polyol phosphate transport system ATPase subunit
MEEVAIKVEKVNKTFKIPHERHSSLKAAAINIFKRKSYTQLEALKNVSFEVNKGEFLGIIGRNGSGKSTLLKMLAGIYVPNSGKITINGKLSPFLELGVGFNPELTARENVFLGGSILGLSRKEIEEKLDDIIKFAELEEFVDMKFKNFSSGMQVRLAFALSINAHAEILLMDEVLAVGDTNFQSKCLDEFYKYKKEGKTVVLVTHDVVTVQRYCDKAMLLKKGKIAMIGDPRMVADEYFKQNISDMNQPKSKKIKEQDQTKKTYITSIELLDEKDQTVKALKPNDSLTIRVNFSSKKQPGEMNFGVAMFTADNYECILGVNSFTDKVEVEKYKKKGYFEVTFSNLPLRHGKYVFKAGIWGENPKKMYDFYESDKSITVVSTDKNDGMVDLSYRWA